MSRIKIFYILPILSCFLLFNTGAKAGEAVKTVVLNDGSSITGRIVKLNTSIIQIKTESGEIITHDFKDVYRIKDESLDKNENYDDIFKKISVGFLMDYASFKGDNFNYNNYDISVDADNAPIVEINLNFIVENNISFEIGILNSKTDVELSGDGRSINIGELKQTAVFINMYSYMEVKKFKPYFGIGCGYYLNKFSTNTDNAELVYGSGADFDTDDSFGFHIIGGCEYFILNNLSINARLKYTINKTDADVNIADYESKSMSLNNMAAGCGIKYYF